MRKMTLALLTLLYIYCTPAVAFAQEKEHAEPLTAPAFNEPRTADVPIIMYHLVTEKHNQIGKYGISLRELENDLRYLRNNGYTTVTMDDLIDFVHRGNPLPEKPIVLTFDDGYGCSYRYLFPLLEKYEMKAVLAILGAEVDRYSDIADKPNASPFQPYLTWSQIKEMHKSKRVEIQNHSYNLHQVPIGSMRKRNEPEPVYHKRLHVDLSKLQERVMDEIGFTPTTYVYPLGAVTKSARVVLSDIGFLASLSCTQGMNRLIEYDPDCLFMLKRDNRPSGRSIGTILQQMHTPDSKEIAK